VILPEIYAYNDNVAAEWFAPAGLNRGGIASAVGVKVRLPQASRDTLYEGKVNPIAQFPGQGICVWGQKTLQRRSSALDRVNVRRLLIAVKKYIASSSRYLVFEQNVEATRNRFLNIVNPYLASVQERSGLYAFRVVMDDTNNTPDVIDRNILYGQLYLQPTRTAEFIVLDFNVLPTGALFPTA
jgi:phage tail sheath protein FI